MNQVQGITASDRLPLPSFYDVKRVGELYKVSAFDVGQMAIEMAMKYGVQPAARDTLKVGVVHIDDQNSFAAKIAASARDHLFVDGSIEASQRYFNNFGYPNAHRITNNYFTMDTHRSKAIYFRYRWRNKSGGMPTPMQDLILFDDVKAGKWTDVKDPLIGLDYTRRLDSPYVIDAAGNVTTEKKETQYALMIWNEHCELGDLGHALVPTTAEYAAFHGALRNYQPYYDVKGTDLDSEQYGPMGYEVEVVNGRRIGEFNNNFARAIISNDLVYVRGYASSHCLLAFLRQMKRWILKTDPLLAKKIRILRDATAPVPPPMANPPAHLDFPAIAEAGFREMEAVGMTVCLTTDPIPLAA